MCSYHRYLKKFEISYVPGGWRGKIGVTCGSWGALREYSRAGSAQKSTPPHSWFCSLLEHRHIHLLWHCPRVFLHYSSKVLTEFWVFDRDHRTQKASNTYKADYYFFLNVADLFLKRSASSASYISLKCLSEQIFILNTSLIQYII